MSVVSVEKDYERRRLTLVAEFAAPIERVWQLWADPRQLERWWGPPTHPATVEKHNLAVGGEVSYVMTGAEGEQTRGWWRVRSVGPPRSLGFTDGFANEDGTPNADLPTIAAEMRLTEHDALEETPCRQLCSTCPCPSTGSSPGRMSDWTTASATAGTAYTSGR
jgi:uncharacterized protein YndB with AHSA1/START domain